MWKELRGVQYGPCHVQPETWTHEPEESPKNLGGILNTIIAGLPT